MLGSSVWVGGLPIAEMLTNRNTDAQVEADRNG
jgi:hypothetical protein